MIELTEKMQALHLAADACLTSVCLSLLAHKDFTEVNAKVSVAGFFTPLDHSPPTSRRITLDIF